ncbi:hypothetical protein FDF74_11545 [Clostridium niameyense]|uniref:Uncharacterized protein n=1 Tax=Clostridium niameyense TaxID=1622073 RepID=A0A6M0RBZ4_9CLOT|nr:hypothetical protein [Clostridium niameyense]NEZ47815.1 hypothetical protein [Clostridium niameyense]
MKICFVYSNNKIEEVKKKHKEKYNTNLELVAKHINNNNKLKKQAVFVIGSLFYVQDVVNAAGEIEKINQVGNKILGIVKLLGFWCCIIGCFIDVAKAVLQHDLKSITKIMLRYGLVYLTFFIFPWILRMIQNIFE